MYLALHGRESPAYNRDFLIKRIAYRLQEIAYGGLSERVHAKLDNVLSENGYDECAMPKRRRKSRATVQMASPIAGCTFVREWKEKRYEVVAVAGGFEYAGRTYRSLTSVAKAITGTHWNGKAFFGASSGRKNR